MFNAVLNEEATCLESPGLELINKIIGRLLHQVIQELYENCARILENGYRKLLAFTPV